MGNKNSTSSTKVEMQRMGQIDDNNNSTEVGAAQDPELRDMRRSLRNDPEVFILNNLMLCVQFFENYEREIRDIRSNSVSQREKDASTLISESQKHILLPGSLEEQVSRHVKFKSTRLPDCDSTIEPLQPVRMHVVLENVSVSEDTEEKNDDTLPVQICYKMRVEPGSNHGYVRLRSLQVVRPRKDEITESSESDLPLIVEDDDEMHNEKEDIPDPGINRGVRFLSQVGKRANAMAAKSIYTQSMTDLYNLDRINAETAALETEKSYWEDEGYEESSYSGNSERRLSGPLRHSRQLKGRSPNMQSSRSTESISRSSRSSAYKSGTPERSLVTESGSDYGYSTATSSNTSDSSTSRPNLPASSSEIPSSCFKNIVFTTDGNLLSEKMKRKKARTAGERRIRKIEECRTEGRSYLRSSRFRRYFKDLFVNRLAKPLGFEIEDDTDVTRQGAVIHCYSIDFRAGNPTLVTPHEIVPSISAKNHPQCHGDLIERSRRAIIDYPNKEIWITKETMDKIEKLGSHIIPESYKPTRDSDPFRGTEWQLTFPAAERYLETCLSNSQAHVYMMALVLRKTFIRSTDSTFELTPIHIRSQLFWLLEENHLSLLWSENRCGESLKELLNKLYSAVSQSQPFLADYFISKKNLFENIPRQYLHLMQKQIKRIIDNPVMYVIAAMKNIRYEPGFFPALDYKRLYKLLTVDDIDLVAFLRPELSHMNRPMPAVHKNHLEIYEERFARIGGLGDRAKAKKSRFCEQVQRGENKKSYVNKSQKVSQELVVQITDECAELRGLRLIAVLGMFIEHFTKMAERSYHYGASKQKDMYLNQAQRLSMILQDQPYGKEDATRYLNTIDTLKRQLFTTRENEPSTSRESGHPTISVPLNQYFIDNPDRQGTTLFMSHEGETDEFDIHHTPAQIERTSNLQSREVSVL